MMQQINEFLSKKPDRRSITILITALTLLCLCCLCLFFLLLQGRTPPPLPATPTLTPSQTLTPTHTITPNPSFSPTTTFTITPTFTLTPSLTITPTGTTRPTWTPSITLTPSITPTPNLLDGPQFLAVFRRTGNVWVTSPKNSTLIELDGNDLHIVSSMIVDSPNGIAIWQDKGLAYVTNKDFNTVTEVDLVAHKITRKIDVGQQPFGVTVEQSSGDVFVANNGSNDVSCIPSDGSAVKTTDNIKEPLDRPTHLIGFKLSDTNPGAAIVIDSSGQVAVVRSNRSTSFSPKELSINIVPCQLTKLGYINKDALADVDQSNDTDPLTFYVTDIDGKSVWLAPLETQPSSPLPRITLPNAPYAVANFDKCIGAVVPSQNRLYIISQDLTQILGQKKTGKQGDNGGWGLAYNPDNNTAYVANPDSNSVTRFETPCQ